MEVLKNRKVWAVSAIILLVSVGLLAVQTSLNSHDNSSASLYVDGKQPILISSPKSTTLNGSVKTPAGVLRYIPVIVDNTQNLSTQVPFDLEVKIDSYALRSVESPSLGNVEWFSLNGTIIPSWIQCNASSSSNCTIYWLKLNNQIPPDFSSTIFMGFENTSVSNFVNGSGLEGEAPQLSDIYGEYDNGNIVFPFYCNFSGSHIPLGWEAGCKNSGYVSVNDGLVINESHNCSVAYVNTNLPVNQNEIIESLVTGYSESGGYPPIEGIGVSTSKFLENLKFNNSQPVEYYFRNGFEADLSRHNGNYNELMPAANGTGISHEVNFTGHPFMIGIGWSDSSTQYWYINDSPVLVTHDSSFESSPLYASAGMTSGGNCSGFMRIQYIRGRYIPPNNVMPLVAGQDVVSDLGCVNFTVSGISRQDIWYVNISGYPSSIESNTLSTCIELPPGNYNYNVSTQFQGSELTGSGSFNVELSSRTLILIVFAPNSRISVPQVSPFVFPPEIYLMIVEVIVLVAGFTLISIKGSKKKLV